MSSSNPVEDGYIAVTKKYRGDIRAVTSIENNKTGRKIRNAIYGVRTSSSLPIVFQKKKRAKLKLYLFHDFFLEVFARDDENSLKE